MLFHLIVGVECSFSVWNAAKHAQSHNMPPFSDPNAKVSSSNAQGAVNG